MKHALLMVVNIALGDDNIPDEVEVLDTYQRARSISLDLRGVVLEPSEIEQINSTGILDDAMIDAAASASGQITYLTGYDGTVDTGALVLILARLVLALYLLSSALSGFDRDKLHPIEIAVRLTLAILLMTRHEMLYLGAAISGIILVVLHVIRKREAIT